MSRQEIYLKNRKWSDEFIPEIHKEIIKCLPYLIEVENSSPVDDMNNAIDIYFNIKGGIACRVRELSNLSKWEDMTLRSIVPYNGRNTEYKKIILDGKCKYYFFAWGKNAKLYKWYIVDLDLVRESRLFEYTHDIHNWCDDTYFRATPFDELFMWNAVIASSHPLAYNSDVVIEDNNIYFFDIKKALGGRQ